MDVSHPVDLSFRVTDQVALIDSVWQRGWLCILTSKSLKIREKIYLLDDRFVVVHKRNHPDRSTCKTPQC